MIRVSDPDATIRFFNLLGLEERRRMDNEGGRFSLIFLGVPGDEGEVELTHNWDESGYGGGPQFRPSRLSGRRYLRDLPAADGRRRHDQPPAARRHMAFVRSPDNISIELLQKGGRLDPAEPWASMANTGEW